MTIPLLLSPVIAALINFRAHIIRPFQKTTNKGVALWLSSAHGRLYEAVNTGASIIFVAIFMTSVEAQVVIKRTIAGTIIDVALGIVFIAHFLVGAAGAKSFREHVLSWPAIASLLSILPIFCGASILGMHSGIVATRFLDALRIFRITHVSALTRIFSMSEINGQLFAIGNLSIHLVCIPAAFIHVFENEKSLWPIEMIPPDDYHARGLTLFDCFYFMVRFHVNTAHDAIAA